MNRIHGSYSLAIAHDDTVLGVRDPLGNRPLCLGKIDGGYVLASESAAIDTLDGELIRDVRPGELVVLEPDGTGYDTYQLVERESTAHCFFRTRLLRAPRLRDRREPRVRGAPCARPEALGGVRRRVRRGDAGSGLRTSVRLRLRRRRRRDDRGRGAAGEDGDDGIAFAEGLMKNRYVGTFIMPTQDERERAVRLKLNPIRSTTGRQIGHDYRRLDRSRDHLDPARRAGPRGGRRGGPPPDRRAGDHRALLLRHRHGDPRGADRRRRVDGRDPREGRRGLAIVSLGRRRRRRARRAARTSVSGVSPASTRSTWRARRRTAISKESRPA